MNPLELLYDYEQAWKSVDHRVDGWIFMSSMWPLNVLIILSFVVLLYGPKFMKTRKPLNIGPIMAANNIALVTINCYIVFQLWLGSSRKQYGWICSPYDSTATDVEEMRIMKAMHLWFICKLMEMFDFVFLIARKKPVGGKWVLAVHHAFMACIVWIIVRWIPSGSVSGAAIVNSASHAIIYCYICLIVFRPGVTKIPLFRVTISLMVIVPLLGCAFYCLAVIWARCPSTWPIFCAFLTITLVMVMYYLLKFLNECRSIGSKRKGVVSSGTNV